MPDIIVPWRQAAGERLIIEVDPGPTTPASGLIIVPRSPTTPLDALLRVQCTAPRTFIWVNPVDASPLLRNGQPRLVTYNPPFQWDVWEVEWGLARAWAAYRSPTAYLITAGAILAPIPDR